MRQQFRSAFTLVELLVVIAIIGTLVGLLLPAVQSAREASRRNQCSSNIVQLAKAMQMHVDSNGKFPGYINGLGIPHGQTTRAPWVVMLFPHLEQSVLWDQWNQGLYNKFVFVETLTCPSNPPSNLEDGSLAYIANCGEWVDQDTDGNLREVPANGIFFNHSRYAEYPEPMLGRNSMDALDTRDDPKADAPIITMTLAYIQSRGDGSSATLMFSESIRTIRYGYFGEPSGLPDDYDDVPDEKYHFGFTWAQPKLTIGPLNTRHPRWAEMRVNGKRETAEYVSLGEMEPFDGWPSSHHNGGVNVAWVAGQVTFMKDNIDQMVYSQLMTTSHKSSTLRDPTGEILERSLPQPTEDQY
jgi:prepilin-type N-terminal cleavage/methylation domain-containing protein